MVQIGKIEAADSGWEDSYQSDLDNNGLISGGSAYKIASSNGAIQLQNKWGTTYDDDTTKSWNALSAYETDTGYDVLLTGEEQSSLNGKIKVWVTDTKGVITEGSEWTDIYKAVESGWEDSYQQDIDNNDYFSSVVIQNCFINLTVRV